MDFESICRPAGEFIIKTACIPHNTLDLKSTSEQLLTNFHILLKAQIEIGHEIDKDKINKILEKHGLPTIPDETKEHHGR